MTLHQFLSAFLAAIQPALAGFAVALLSVGTLAVYNWGRLRGLQAQLDRLDPHAPPTIVTVPAPPQGPVVAASVTCPHCGHAVHLQGLQPPAHAGPRRAP